MSGNVETASTSMDASLPTAEEINGWDRDRLREFLRGKKAELELEEEDIDKLYDNRVKGENFLRLIRDDLLSIKIPLGPASDIGNLISQIQGVQHVVGQTAKKQRLGSQFFTHLLEVIIEFRNHELPEFLRDNIEEQETDNLEELIKKQEGESLKEQETEELIEKQEESLFSQDTFSHPEGKHLPLIDGYTLYVRKAYEDLYHIITKKYCDHKFLISGTSGVGKSCFLIYLLVRLLCNNNDATVIFNPLNENLLYCFEGTKLLVGKFSEFSNKLYNPKTWYLVDGEAPENVDAIVVVSASSKSIKSKEFKEFVKCLDNIFYMPPWSLEELEICREKTFPMVPLDLMCDLVDEAGGVPRYVLQMPANIIRNQPNWKELGDPVTHIGRDVIKKRSLKRIEDAIYEISNTTALMQCLFENAQYIEHNSYLIHRWPDTSYQEQYFSWASNKIFDKIQKKLEDDRWNNLFLRMQDPDDPSSSRGIFFESHVLHLFRVGGDQRLCTRKLQNNDDKIPQTSYFEIEKNPHIEYIRKAIHLQNYDTNERIIVKPTIKNFAADLIVFPDKIFQITVSQNHSIEHYEIVKIVQNMPAYRMDCNARIFLYFLVPEDIYDDFRYQRYVTRKKKIGNDLETFQEIKRVSSVLKNVEQWVVKI